MLDDVLVFRFHAMQQMVLREISETEVRDALEVGETIETYPDEFPFPARLILGWSGSRPLHMVAMDDPKAGHTVIITVYEPDRRRWSADFRSRTKR